MIHLGRISNIESRSGLLEVNRVRARSGSPAVAPRTHMSADRLAKRLAEQLVGGQAVSCCALSAEMAPRLVSLVGHAHLVRLLRMSWTTHEMSASLTWIEVASDHREDVDEYSGVCRALRRGGFLPGKRCHAIWYPRSPLSARERRSFELSAAEEGRTWRRASMEAVAAVVRGASPYCGKTAHTLIVGCTRPRASIMRCGAAARFQGTRGCGGARRGPGRPRHRRRPQRPRMSRETPSIPRCDSHLRRRVFALSTRYRGYKWRWGDAHQLG